MATISSAGIGSGLDVNSIVTQLVALEKQPLAGLQNKAKLEQNQISEFSKIQSQFSALADAASAMASTTAWGARNASSSNSSAATISVTAGTDATSFTLDIDALAKAQSTTSGAIAHGATVGAGTMTIDLGTWSSGPTSFQAGASTVSITVSDTDTVATLAKKINDKNPGVVATSFFDGTSDRLLIRSKDTGVAAGFRIQTSETDGTNADETGLSRFAYDPEAGAYGMAAAGLAVQSGEQAKARINGLAITSDSNTLSSNIPGVTIKLLATTTTNYNNVGGTEVKSPVSLTVSEDVTQAVKNISNLVDAYNAVSKNISDLTKYDAATKTTGLFQGDSSILAMQSMLRKMVGSSTTGSVYSRLSDVGIEMQRDGTLLMNTTKLSAAANNGTELQKLFYQEKNLDPLTTGFAQKFKAFGTDLLAWDGSVTTKAAALKKQLDSNATEQTRVNDRAAAVEARLRKQYSALDARMASLTALNAYVAQQVTTWNKSTG